MFKQSLTLALAYLLFGLVASVLARKGRPEEWDETLLASVLGPPLAIIVAGLVLGTLIWSRWTGTKPGKTPVLRLH